MYDDMPYHDISCYCIRAAILRSMKMVVFQRKESL